jgi:hypothetical protein
MEKIVPLFKPYRIIFYLNFSEQGKILFGLVKVWINLNSLKDVWIAFECVWPVWIGSNHGTVPCGPHVSRRAACSYSRVLQLSPLKRNLVPRLRQEGELKKMTDDAINWRGWDIRLVDMKEWLSPRRSFSFGRRVTEVIYYSCSNSNAKGNDFYWVNMSRMILFHASYYTIHPVHFNS